MSAPHEREVRVFVAVWIACCALLFARRPDLITNPQFLAEDGVVFFRDQVLHGIASVMLPYAGYHHLLPRLVAALAAPLPIAFQPTAYAALTVALEAASCAALVPILERTVADVRVRALAAIGVSAAIPADGVIGSVANVQFYVALPVLAASIVPLRRTLFVPMRIAAILVGFTTPQGLLALPFALYRWVRRAPEQDPWIPTIYSIASAINVVTAGYSVAEVKTPGWALGGVVSTCYRAVDAVWFGFNEAIALANWNSALGAAIGAVLLIALTVAVARTFGRAAAAALLFVTIAPAMLVLHARAITGTELDRHGFFGGDRYFVGASAAVVVAAILAASRVNAPWRPWVLAAVVLLPLVGNFTEPKPLEPENWRSFAPRIPGWIAARNAGRATPVVRGRIPPEWTLELPACVISSPGGVLSCG